MKKRMLSAIILGTLCLTCMLGALVAEVLPERATLPSESTQIQPYEMDIAEGTATGSAFEMKKSLTSKNGKTVNFWIQNNGTTSVAITINGKGSRTVKPRTQGHISADVGYFTTDYTFKASPTPNGGDIDIEYEIAQRD